MKHLLPAFLLSAFSAAVSPGALADATPADLPHADSPAAATAPLAWRAEHVAFPTDSPSAVHLVTRLVFRNATDAPLPLPSAILHPADPAGETCPFDPPPRLDPVPPRGELVLVLLDEPAMPAEIRTVYDGVRFDRFPRSPRTDWHYGTGCSPLVTTHLTLRNTSDTTLPPGPLRLIRYDAKRNPSPVGEAALPLLRRRGSATLDLGPAANLLGTRRRLACNEVIPGTVFEETFAVTLENRTGDDTVVRVLEHLYRGGVPSITASDFPYAADGPGTIRFDVPVKAGTSKTVTYTAHYIW